ncbi:MAG: T9SS type A sorting domain-containing protein [Flavobacteriales bacterium]|nr:T9SS type A sorting domain-containing protein [Flavobacteriales bacterium]
MLKPLRFLAVLLIGASFSSYGQASNYPNGSTVANFEVTDTDGNTHDLYEITASGKYVYFDFFFDTCPPCQATSQYFNDLYDKYGCNAGDLYCITINNGTDSDAEVVAYEEEYGGDSHHAPAVSADGGGGDVTAAFGVGAFPTYCLVGPDNIMVANDIWPISSAADLEAAFPSGFNPTEMACSFAGVEESTIDVLSVYPNPANTELNIQFNSAVAGTAQVEIFNVVGERVDAFTINTVNGSNNSTLDVTNYSNGQFFAHITMDDQVSTIRFDVLR